MNIHTPERQADESQQQYRERRKQSRIANVVMTWAHNRGDSARKKLRDVQRRKGNLRGVYGAGLIAAWAAKQKRALELKRGL